jgi:glycosyltransferase involved in cell wall biosynthesis
MKVLHVIPAVAARYGGPSVAIFGMCRALQAAGTSTMVATTDADGRTRLRVPIGQPVSHDGVSTIFFRRYLGDAFKWSGALAAWLGEHVRDFDVVHIHAVFNHSSIAAARACVDRGVPFVLRPLGTLDPWSLGRKPLRKQVLRSLGADRLLSQATAVHYTSDEEKRLAEAQVPDLPAGAVIPLGIDDEFFEMAAPEGINRSAPYVLALTRLDEKKGLDLLVRAFAQTVRTPALRHWRLVIAGGGAASYVARLEALAKAARGDGATVELRGWVTGAHKTALLRGASLFASPSHQENFGISLVEALACGVPALLTPGVNLANDVERADAGWVVARTERALTESLTALLSNAANLERHGRSARTFANQFRWPLIATRLQSLYRDVLSGVPTHEVA